MHPKTFFKQNGITLQEAAAAWGVPHTSISRALNGKQWPMPAIMVHIDRLSHGKVTVGDWVDCCAEYLTRMGIKQERKSNGRTRKAEGIDEQAEGGAQGG